MDSAISLRELKVGWGADCVLHDLQLEILRGEVLCIVGPGASGKSTLLRTLEFMVGRAQGCEAEFGLWWSGGIGVAVEGCLRLPQHGTFSSREVGDLLHEAALDDLAWLPGASERMTVAALAHTPLVEVVDPLRRVISFALVAASSAPLLLVDEPTVGLPEPWAGFIGGWLRALPRQGHTTVFVTHHLPLARSASDRVALLVDGRLIELSPTEDFFCRAQNPRTQRYLQWGG